MALDKESGGDEDGRVDEVAVALGLFGRADALRAVSDLMDRGGSVVAVGDPGAGKSSLLKVAAQVARRQGRTVLLVTPTQFERGLPFAGLAELVSQCPQGADQSLPGPQRRALAVALQRAAPGGPQVDALAVPLAVRGLLTQLCESEPVALLIDDLQWLDPASVGSLGFALRGSSDDFHRLSVLVATRPDPATGTDLIRSLAEPRHEFVLRPLEDWAIGQLLRSRLGPRWTPPMSAGVARASGGNPFLALEIARTMQAEVLNWHGSAHSGRDPVFPVPGSLVDLLRERVARLPQDAREVLLHVSAAGRLTVAQLHGIVAEARLWRALEAAADAEVAIVGAGSVVAFTHPLLASAVYDAAAPSERRRAHRFLADSLEDPVERARHRSRSTTVPDEAVAADLERAAELSQARGAPRLAGELLEGSALATPSGADSTASLGRWLRAVDAYFAAGDEMAARAALDKGSALAIDPEQRAQVLARRAHLADDVLTARSLTEQALLLAPTGSHIRVQILAMLAAHCRTLGEGARALDLTRMAITEAGAVQRWDLQINSLVERVLVERNWGLGQPQRSLRDVERLAGGATPPPPMLAFTRGFFAAWNDPAAERHVRDGITSAVDAGHYGTLSSLYISLMLVLIRASKVREAQAALEEAARSGAWAMAAGEWAWRSSLQQDIAHIMVNAYAGNLDAARERARAAIARPHIRGSTYWRAAFLGHLGFIETSARNWPAALEPLRELADIFARTKMVDLEAMLWGVDYADAALQVGATREVESAISILRRQGSAGRPEAAVAADRCQALLTAASGDADGAVTALRGIVDQPGSECPFEAARSRLALGQVYRRAGHKGMANEALKAAAGTFAELGIPRWAERAWAEAGRVGLHPTTGTLTATERRVAELVGSGRSNQETAAELFMSVKSVEANLTRIYRKLSVRSRTELANRLNKLDFTTNPEPTG